MLNKVTPPWESNPAPFPVSNLFWAPCSTIWAGSWLVQSSSLIQNKEGHDLARDRKIWAGFYIRTTLRNTAFAWQKNFQSPGGTCILGHWMCSTKIPRFSILTQNLTFTNSQSWHFAIAQRLQPLTPLSTMKWISPPEKYFQVWTPSFPISLFGFSRGVRSRHFACADVLINTWYLDDNLTGASGHNCLKLIWPQKKHLIVKPWFNWHWIPHIYNLISCNDKSWFRNLLRTPKLLLRLYPHHWGQKFSSV